MEGHELLNPGNWPTIWAAVPGTDQRIAQAIRGGTLAARRSQQAPAGERQGGDGSGVAIIQVYGAIWSNPNPFFVSAEEISALLGFALQNDGFGAVVLDIRSPGGSASGIQECADGILFAKGDKPIIAVASCQAASAAYWIASACDQLVVSPSAEVGSIGVFSTHVDCSAQNKARGEDVTYIYAGKYKVEGNPDEPLSDDARAYEQSRINEFYESFVKDVAAGRGASTSEVKSRFGQGRSVGATAAVKLGMADRIAPLSQVVGELAAGKMPRTTSRENRLRSAMEIRKRRIALGIEKLRGASSSLTGGSSGIGSGAPRKGSPEWAKAERKRIAQLRS